MSGSWYNGYNWNQRAAILRAMHRGEAGPGFLTEPNPCGLCGDPERPSNEWHSEDYSLPFSFSPPQTYPLCKTCHSRLHKRFKQPNSEWELFCRHVECGGYGGEFTKRYSLLQRRKMCAAIERGEEVSFESVRALPDRLPWWRELTLDPGSLHAAWARPRPLRPRPVAAAYRAALAEAVPSESEAEILRFHAAAPRRSVAMRQVAAAVLGSDQPSAANLAYGRLAKRIGQRLDWTPDRRADGSPFWMSVLAEGWQPTSTREARREYELVMIPTLAQIIGNEKVRDAVSEE